MNNGYEWAKANAFLPWRATPRQIAARPVIRRSRTHRGRPVLALACAGALCCVASGADHTNRFDWLKPFQRIQYGTPPLSPREFNPDAGIRLKPNFVEDATIAYELKRWTNTVPLQPPPQFNPDPGASLKKPVAPARPFFQYEVIPLPGFSGEVIQPGLELPRAPVTQNELLLREPEVSPPPYGW